MLNLPPQADDAPTVRESIREHVESAVRQAGWLKQVAESEEGSHVLVVDVGRVLHPVGEGNPLRPVDVRLRPRGEGIEYAARGRGLPLAELGESTLTGFDDAWEVIAQQVLLASGNKDRLLVALEHPDARVRGFAIQRVGELQLEAAVKPLMERLDVEPREELVLRAVGALVAIGDKRAVPSLIELTRQREPQFVVQVVYALGALGGPTAEGYLVTLASGHPVPAVQRSAQEALDELQASRASLPLE